MGPNNINHLSGMSQVLLKLTPVVMNGQKGDDNRDKMVIGRHRAVHSGKVDILQERKEWVLRFQNISISWSIQCMYSGNGFKQISGNALDLREEALPVGDHGQLGLGELLKIHHDDLLEVSHPVVLEQLHLHLR